MWTLFDVTQQVFVLLVVMKETIVRIVLGLDTKKMKTFEQLLAQKTNTKLEINPFKSSSMKYADRQKGRNKT
jgi:hypothetical protein